jgi:hypothetical protein
MIEDKIFIVIDVQKIILAWKPANIINIPGLNNHLTPLPRMGERGWGEG